MPAPAKSREAPDGSDPRMVDRRASLARRRLAAGAAPDHARGRRHPALRRAGHLRELLGRDPAGGDRPRREALRLREDLQAGGGLRRPRAGAAAARGTPPPEPAGADDVRGHDRAEQRRRRRRDERSRRRGWRPERAAARDVRGSEPRQGPARQAGQADRRDRAQPGRRPRPAPASAQGLREQGPPGRLADRERLARVLMAPPFAFVNAFLARHPLVRRLLLPALGLIAFALFLVLTFPYEVLARRIEIEAQRAGAELSIGSAGAGGLASVRARDVRVRLAPAAGSAWPELRFDRAVFSPDILALLFRRTSFGFSVRGYGGTAKGHVALSNDPRLPGVSSLRLDAVDLDLAALPLREMAGVSVAGKLRVKADLPALLPVETAQGALTLVLDGAALTGGTVMGFSLPPTTLGRIDGSVAVEKGIARVDKTAARGGDLEADVDGNVNLRPLLSLSQADLHLRFRPADHWLNENSAIKGMMGLIQNARQGDGSYVFTFSGPLSRLQPRPGR